MAKRKTLSILVLCVASPLFALAAQAAEPPPPPPMDDGPAKEARPRVAIDGTFDRYLVSPHGDIDGLLLKDGTVVKLPPNSLPQSALGSGDAVHVDGEVVATPGGRVVERAVLTHKGTTLLDASAPKPPGPGRGPGPRRHGPAADATLQPLTVSGNILTLLANRRGDLDGLVLRDGTAARVPPHARLEQYGLRVGDAVTVSGRGGSYAAGRGLRVESLKVPSGKTYVIDTPPPPPGAAPPSEPARPSAP